MNVWLIIGLGLLGSVLLTLAMARMLGGRSVTPSEPDWRTSGITFPSGWAESDHYSVPARFIPTEGIIRHAWHERCARFGAVLNDIGDEVDAECFR